MESNSSTATRATPAILMGHRQEQMVEERRDNGGNESGRTWAASRENLSSDFVKNPALFCQSDYPIEPHGKLDMNVNSHHGGGASLYFISTKCRIERSDRSRKCEKGKGTYVEIFLVRNGFDCNHVEMKSICEDREGDYKGRPRFRTTDEEGTFIGGCNPGKNHLMLLSNESQVGNLRNGVYVESASNSTTTDLPLNTNGKDGSGVTLLLCSSVDSGNLVHAAYMVRSGYKENKYRAKVITGMDKFRFSVDPEGNLRVTGPGEKSKYSLFHNRDNLTSHPGYAYVCQYQNLLGTTRQVLMDNLASHVILMVICSSSNGFEDSTVAAVYYLAVCSGNLSVSQLVAGLQGSSYSEADLWKFSAGSGQLVVEGPDGPCKYGILTNMKASKQELLRSVKQGFCLATGEETRTVGKVKVTQDGVKGEINRSSNINIMFDHKNLVTIASNALRKAGSMYTFSFDWGPDEKVVGYHMVRVFAVRRHTTTKEDVQIELLGSPTPITRQKPGVLYAVNCGGPAYQAINDVVYTSEFHQYANFSYKCCAGFRSRTRGETNNLESLPSLMLNTNDGFLFVSQRMPAAPGFEAYDHEILRYEVSDIPNGNHTLRLHVVGCNSNFKVNDTDISKKINSKIAVLKKPTDMEGHSSYMLDVDVAITNGKIVIEIVHDPKLHYEFTTESISGFAILDKSYKEKTKTAEQTVAEEKEKATLSDRAKPLNVAVTKKKLKIVGWSRNLLENASGSEGSMKHWKTSGEILVIDEGHGTDKCFVTSYMWCSKYQAINLLDENFTAEYLETAPDIKVSEAYLEGTCRGGFYVMTAQLLTQDGKVVDEYTTGVIGSIYNDQQWNRVSHTFKNYGPGVRIVSFTSKGKDDKYWAGPYGTKMSNADVRVKRASKAAPDDAFEDLKIEDLSETSGIDSLVSTLLVKNEGLLNENQAEEEEKAQKASLAHLMKQAALKRATLNRPKSRKKREIRVFVSSTFKDFKQEREEIIKKAFIEVNRLCADRGVFFTYVDLRWGITSEQSGDGKTLSICLQEIDRCRPYFICLMGERFGWSQRKDNPDKNLDMAFNYALENNPNLKWIEDKRYDASATELEIFHGVLNNVEAAKDYAFFYLRDKPVKEELSKDDYEIRMPESDWHQERVDWLKSQVMQHKELKIGRFKHASEVADMIKEDLGKRIDEDFPAGTQLTKLEQQREAHYAFALVRCQVYIGQEEYFTEINVNRQKQIHQPYVLLGESGSGKSALIANWCKRVEDTEPGTFMFMHFIGSSADSASCTKLLRRLFEELKLFYNFDMQIPSSDTLLIKDLPKWLRLAGSRSKVVVVLDALNQLDDSSGNDGAKHDLNWLPPELPPHVFLLLSTLPGRTLKAVEKFGWPCMHVKPLQDGDKNQIITDYLDGIYGKALDTEQKELIVNAPQTSNPLFLKSLLDEVRMYGSYLELTEKIKDYLTAETPSALFAKILERLEADFEHGEEARTKLVYDAMAALWCSNKGISESELVELLQVQSVVWSPFFLSLYESLVNRDGLLNFFHDHLRQAVENKYLPTDEAKHQGYLQLANFFSQKETSDRTVEELPFLLTKAGELGRLKEYMKDLEVFRRLSQSEDGYFELVKAWKTLGSFSLAEEAYMEEVSKLSTEQIVANHKYYYNVFSNLGDFFRELGLVEPAKKIYVMLIQQLEREYGESHGTIVYSPWNQSWQYKCKHPDVIKNLQNLGHVFIETGEIDKAIMTFKDAIGRQNRIETPSQEIQLCEGLLGLADAETRACDEGFVESKKLMTRALELATTVLGRKHHFVASIYLKLGQLSYKQSRLQEALAFFLLDLRSTRSEFGTHHPSVATVLNEIALVYDDMNDEMAGKLYEGALSIIMETYGNDFLGTGVIRYNLGTFYLGTNYFAKASYQFEEAYKIYASFLGEEHPDSQNVKKALEIARGLMK